MAEEYLKLLDEARKRFARGEDASDLIPKLTEAIAKMTKEAREAALKSPGLTPDEAQKEADKLFKDADSLFMVQFALQLAASYIPLTNASAMLAKAFEAPSFRWQFDIAYRVIDLKQQSRVIAPLQRYYNKEYLPNIVDVQTIIRLHQRQYFDDDAYNALMALWGYSGAEAATYTAAAKILPSLADVLKMNWRGLINSDLLKAHLPKIGYDTNDVDSIIAIQEPIPGSGDLTTMVAREAFPLADLPNAPAEYIAWMAKQGYAKGWANAYWHIHYRYVPLNTLYELFHRGFITLPELTTYLTIEDLAPFKRPGQSKTDVELAVEASYALLPRIDLRFGWFTGALTDAEVKALYEKYGLKAEDATKELGIQKARILEIYRRGYLSTLQLAYRRGKITADAFRSKVVAEKFPSEVADWLIKSEDLRMSLGAGVESVAEDRALTKADLIRLYRRGIIDQARLKSELVNMNYSAAEIALLIADADYTAPIESREAVKIVSLSDLETLYKRALRKRDDIIRDLKYRNYTDVDVALLLQIWDAEIAEKAAAKPVVKVAIPSLSSGDLKLAYRTGVISETAFRAELSERLFAGADIDVLVALEQARMPIPPAEKIPEVSVAKLEELFRKGIISEEEYADELRRRKYADADITKIIAAAKFKPVIPVPTAKPTLLPVSNILHSRSLGIITESQMVFELRDHGYSDAQAYRLWEEYARWPPTTITLAQISASEALDAFEKGLKDEAWTRAQLLAQNYAKERVDLLVEAEKAKIEASKPIIKVTLPMLSLGDLRLAYRNGIISETAFRAELAERLFAGVDIDVLVTLEQKRMPMPPAEKIPEASVARLEELFRKGIVSEEEFAAELTTRNYSTKDVANIVAAAKFKPAIPIPTAKPVLLSVSNTLNARAKGIITESQMVFELRDHGYSNAQAYRLWEEYARPLPSAVVPKAFSLSDLQFAWENGLVDSTSLASRIGTMGYTAEDAALMTQLTKARALENERNRLLAITESRFKVGLGTEAEARAFMSSLGYITERQDIIIGAWTMERDLGIATDIRDAWLKAYSKGQTRESVYGYLTAVLKLDADVVDALLLLEDAKLLKA